MNSFWQEKTAMIAHLNEVDQVIGKQLTVKQRKMNEILQDLASSGGKRIRPGLCIIGAGFGSKPIESIYPLAAVLEMLHLATLVHDDIIDESKLRRGHESIQSKFGKDTAVYAGDYLLTGMFSLLEQANLPQANRLALTALQDILFGELVQKHHRYDITATFDSYLSQIKGKTAALFKLSVTYGLISGNAIADDLHDIVSELGENLGMTFQLLDDYLDFESITQQLSLGKPIGQDIRNGIYTAPVLFALTDPTVNTEVRALLMQRDAIRDADMIRLHELITQSHAMTKLNALLTDYTDKLQALIARLPEPTIQTQLEQLSHLLLNRNH